MALFFIYFYFLLLFGFVFDIKAIFITYPLSIHHVCSYRRIICQKTHKKFGKKKTSVINQNTSELNSSYFKKMINIISILRTIFLSKMNHLGRKIMEILAQKHYRTGLFYFGALGPFDWRPSYVLPSLIHQLTSWNPFALNTFLLVPIPFMFLLKALNPDFGSGFAVLW